MSAPLVLLFLWLKGLAAGADEHVPSFCPPERISSACLSKEKKGNFSVAFIHALLSASKLWRIATRGKISRILKAYLRLFETTRALDCAAAFSGCFSDKSTEARNVMTLCGVLERDWAEVLRSNPLILQTHGTCDSSVRSTSIKEHLQSNLCYSKFSTSSFASPTKRIGAVAGFARVLLDASIASHVSFREQILAAAENMFGSSRELPWLVSIPTWSRHHAHRVGPRCDLKQLPSWYNRPNVSTLLSKLNEASNGVCGRGWVVNLGAGKGGCGSSTIAYGPEAEDPANCLMLDGHGGLLFEGDPRTFPLLKESYAHRADIDLHLRYISPDDVSEPIRQYSKNSGTCPLGLLKIDVDNCDCCFLERILQAGFRPLLVHVEVHSEVPPPIVFRPTRFAHKPSEHLQSCSISAFEELLTPLGYKLLHMNLFDAVFAEAGARQKLFAHAERSGHRWGSLIDASAYEHWLGGFDCHPMRYFMDVRSASQMFSYDYRRWSDGRLSLERRIELIRAYLHEHNVDPRSYALYVGEQARTSNS